MPSACCCAGANRKLFIDCLTGDVYRARAINRSEHEQGVYALHRVFLVSTFTVISLLGKWVS